MAPFGRENQLVQTKKKKKTELKRRAPDLKNQDASYIVQLKDSICFK
jgi:hypothetical protein